MNGESKGPEKAGWQTATVELSVAGERFETRLTVPAGPASPRQLLPVLRPLSEALLGVAVARAQAAGERVSCAKGCGACCRQLVPISQAEARAIALLVEELPEPRRSEIRSRFAQARRRIEEAGLLQRIVDPESFPDETLQKLGLTYFHLGIACPFLEDESCSIYEDRPISCREYLVTSPARECARPSEKTIRTVEPESKVWIALARLDEDPARRFIPWVPLSMAPEWAHAHPEAVPARTGPELLGVFFRKLAQKKKKASDSAYPID